MESVPESHQDLLVDEVKAIAYLATIMPDGTPQVTPVWFNVDGGYFLINSAVGRIKDRNMRDRPNIALTIADPTTVYRYLQIRGVVVEITEENALDHINKLAYKYLDTPTYSNFDESETRVKYRIKPTHLSAFK